MNETTTGLDLVREHLCEVVVEPDYRRHGLMHQLSKHAALLAAAAVGLAVSVAVTVAVVNRQREPKGLRRLLS